MQRVSLSPLVFALVDCQELSPPPPLTINVTFLNMNMICMRGHPPLQFGAFPPRGKREREKKDTSEIEFEIALDILTQPIGTIEADRSIKHLYIYTHTHGIALVNPDLTLRLIGGHTIEPLLTPKSARRFDRPEKKINWVRHTSSLCSDSFNIA